MEAWQPSMVIPSGGKFSKGTQPEILLTDLQLIHSELCLLIYLKIISFFQPNSPNRTRFNLKTSVLWNITSYSPVKANGNFGGICRLNFQGLTVSEARTLYEAGSKHEAPNEITALLTHITAPQLSLISTGKSSRSDISGKRII